MPIKIVVPELGESVVAATVGRWLKREGHHVAVGEGVAELETDKVNLEVGAERTGVLVRIERKEGEDVRVGDVLGVIEEAPPQEPMRTPAEERAKATPVAKSLAQAYGVDLAQVPASGPGGRVTKEDILSSLERRKASRVTSPSRRT